MTNWQERQVAQRNLTQVESLALRGRLNLADGHARQDLMPDQQRIVAELPDLWSRALSQRDEDIERAAQQAYFELVGQAGYPRGRVLSCYSSSVAMEIVARSLATAIDSVALIHPTFDNIPDILRGVGIHLTPIEEDALHRHDVDSAVLRSVGGVFVTTPNNPTGRVLSATRLARLAEQCAQQGTVLILDSSFRGFDPAAHYDHYAVLEASGCRWIVIEDTGKLWPTLELKVGWLVFCEHIELPLATIHSDILLAVSPLVLLLVQRFAEDAAGGGLTELHRLIADNRAAVRRGLVDVPGVRFPDATSKASVERVHVGPRSATELWSTLRELGLFTLPCGRFHWADPVRGDDTLRIALARSPSTMDKAMYVLRSVLGQT